MLWQQNVHVVVMLTKVYEFIRVMCTQYWPGTLHKPELYDNGQFEVTLVDEDRLADYVVRTMRVRNLKHFPRKKNNEGEDEENEASFEGKIIYLSYLILLFPLFLDKLSIDEQVCLYL